MLEVPILDVSAWPSADFYLDPAGQTNLIGATLRLYACAEEVRTLEASLTIRDVSQGIRISAAARGCTRWQATIEWPVSGTPHTTAPVVVVLVSFDVAGAAPQTLAPQGGGAPPLGRASWYGVPATTNAGVIKAAAGNLWQLAATNAGGAATWFLVFDDPAPAAGATPLMRAYVPSLAVASWVLTDPQDPSPAGREFQLAIAWAASSTPDVLTPDLAAALDVSAKYE